MSEHALSVLEYHRVLEAVAGRALSPLGRDHVLALRPSTHLSVVQRELGRVDELARFLDRHADWNPPAIPDAGAALERLALEGSVLEPQDLLSIGTLLASGRHLQSGLAKAVGELPGFQPIRDGLYQDRESEKRIGRIVDQDGSILDTASKELGRIRSRLRRLHSTLVQILEKVLGQLPERLRVADASVTIREGRYVIPVRREGRGEVGGAVLDESATGATLFIEPPVAQEKMAELRELQRAEAREIQRILRSETDAVRPLLPVLEVSQQSLVTFDSYFARARAALAWEGTAPTLLPAGTQEVEIVHGRHPLLLAAGGDTVVPFHLSLDPGERALVVSGPNTGGKSVFLKAVGLIASLAQSGIIPPTGEGTRIPMFTGIYADIGDEQSISESLSTFSAHVENLKQIVAEADGESLVLVDEMGTGTDPQEGAALSRTILEHLVAAGALTIVTSHLGALKRLDSGGSGVVNASLQFDPDRIEPTYHLLKGRPGRSYGLAIARRLGFPPDLLDRAEGHLPKDEARMEELLAALERKEKEASRLVEALTAERKRAEELKGGLEEREAVLKDQERTARARAQEEARRLLLEARKEVEEAIKDVRASAEEAADQTAVDTASQHARRRVEEAARKHRVPRRSGAPSRRPGTGVAPGHRVSLSGTGSKGVVLEIRDERALVESSGMKFQVPISDLEDLGPAMQSSGGGPSSSGSGASMASSWQGPEAEPEPETDLRGLRVADVQLEVDRAIDQAVLGGLGEVRIIHGKGTGALRASVAELLENDARVASYRLGGPAEGGAGVTVVKLR
jgi:DNA mismatch repair protein MutS2